MLFVEDSQKIFILMMDLLLILILRSQSIYAFIIILYAKL